MILDLISQSVLEKALSNQEDSMPNKIKEKEESLQNTLNKRFSIPMIVLDEDKPIVSKHENNYASVTYGNVDTEYSAQPTINVETNQKNSSDIIENYGYDIISLDNRTFIEGEEKPINVKEHMIINMMKKDINSNDEYRGLHAGKNGTNETYEEHIVNEIETEKVQFEEPKEIIEHVDSEIGKYGIPLNIEKALSSTFDFDNTMVAIHQTREEYKNVSEQANIATQAANESEVLLQKVSSEYSEAEKQLREKEKRSIEMEQKIISILNTEKNRISQQMQKKESLINDANKRKEQIDGKIVDFRSKINSAKEKENEIDEKLSRQEELLNTLVGFKINLEDDKLIEEAKAVGKVA